MFNKTVKKRHYIVFKNYFLQIVFLQKNITLQKQFGVGYLWTQAVYFWQPRLHKNTRKLRFHVFLLFHVTYMKYTKYIYFTWSRPNCEFCSNCGSPGTRTKLAEIHIFLWNSQFLVNFVNFMWNDDVICFLALEWKNTWNLSFLTFYE